MDDFKKEKGQKISKCFWDEKKTMLQMKNNVLKNHPRLQIFHQILMPESKIFNINQKNDLKYQNKKLLKSNTKDIVLSPELMKQIIHMMENLKETF